MNQDIPTDPELNRVDSQAFVAAVDALVREAEQTRLEHMQARQRRGFITLTLSLLLLLAGGSGFGWYFLVEGDLFTALTCVAMSVIPPFLLALWKDQPVKSYIRNHKRYFMPKMAKILGGFSYKAEGGISSKIFKATAIVPPYSTYKSEDCFMGRYKGIKAILSEAQLYRGSLIFQGLFVLLEIPDAAFDGRIILTADPAMAQENAATRWKGLKRVAVTASNPEWNRFMVFSDASPGTLEIVSEKLLKELSEAADVFNKSALTVSMFGGCYVFIMIPYRGDMFEPSDIHEAIPTRENALERHREVEKIMEVIDVFDACRKPQPVAG